MHTGASSFGGHDLRQSEVRPVTLLSIFPKGLMGSHKRHDKAASLSHDWPPCLSVWTFLTINRRAVQQLRETESRQSALVAWGCVCAAGASVASGVANDRVV